MKNIFGTNVTNGHDNTYDGLVFYSDSIIETLGDAYEKYIKIQNIIEKKTTLSFWMRIIKYLSFIFASSINTIVINISNDKKAYDNSLVLLCAMKLLFAIFLVIFIAVQLLEWQKKRYKKGEEYNRGKRYMQTVEKYSKTLLKIPEEAKVIDALTFYYENKNGKERIVEIGLNSYLNYEFSIFVDRNNFYIANFCSKWTIPLNCITGIKKINKKICISAWNKEVSYNKEKYKKYKIKSNLLGQIFFKPYYALCIKWQGENYELFIPSYDFDVFTTVVKLK